MPSLTEFFERRRPEWDELNRLVQITGTRGGIKKLSREQLARFGPLYRRAAADLAYARLRGADPALLEHLNALVLRAHGLLYAERGPGASRLWGFLSKGFPTLLRKSAPYVLIPTGLFFLGMAIGAGLQWRDPAFLIALGDDPEGRRDMYKDMPTAESDAGRPADAAFLMTHNTRVAFTAFSLGILGAAPAALPVLMTGLQVGAIAVEQHRAGNSLWFWSFIAPHAVPELTAIFIAAGAGMMIGKSLIAPGDLARRDAVKLASRTAVRLVLGTVALFVLAGLTESFVSPTSLPPWAKFGFLGLMATLLTLYLQLGKSNQKHS